MTYCHLKNLFLWHNGLKSNLVRFWIIVNRITKNLKIMNLITHNLRPILFDDFINDFFGNINQNNTPLYNIFENDKEYKIEFSVPGFDKKQFSVEIENDILRVSNTSEDEVSDKYYKRQFNYSNFSKTFNLPEIVNIDKISSEYKNGILRVILPKVKEIKNDKIKSIDIK